MVLGGSQTEITDPSHHEAVQPVNPFFHRQRARAGRDLPDFLPETLNRPGSQTDRGLPVRQKAEAEELAFHGRFTALLSRFTFSLSFPSTTRITDSMIRSPARLLATKILQSSAYRTKRNPRLISSLSRSSGRMLASSGLSGPPCGVPSSVRTTTPPVITPAFRQARISLSTRLSSILRATLAIRML